MERGGDAEHWEQLPHAQHLGFELPGSLPVRCCVDALSANAAKLAICVCGRAAPFRFGDLASAQLLLLLLLLLLLRRSPLPIGVAPLVSCAPL